MTQLHLKAFVDCRRPKINLPSNGCMKIPITAISEPTPVLDGEGKFDPQQGPSFSVVLMNGWI